MSGRSRISSEAVERTKITSLSRMQTSVNPDEVIFLRLPGVKTVTGLSKTSLYEMIRANSFPAPVRLGPRTVAWVSSEVREWAAERILRSRSTIPSLGSKRTPQRALGEAWTPSRKWA
jgi:prophage regulatory protein